jgi:hypothetical protein
VKTSSTAATRAAQNVNLLCRRSAIGRVFAHTNALGFVERPAEYNTASRVLAERSSAIQQSSTLRYDGLSIGSGRMSVNCPIQDNARSQMNSIA